MTGAAANAIASPVKCTRRPKFDQIDAIFQWGLHEFLTDIVDSTRRSAETELSSILAATFSLALGRRHRARESRWGSQDVIAFRNKTAG
jgi:hypothetical protein